MIAPCFEAAGEDEESWLGLTNGEAGGGGGALDGVDVVSSLPDGFTEALPTVFECTLFLPSFVTPSFFIEPDVAKIDAGGGGGALDGAAFVLSLPDGFTEAFPIIFEATLSLSSTGALPGAAEDS